MYVYIASRCIRPPPPPPFHASRTTPVSEIYAGIGRSELLGKRREAPGARRDDEEQKDRRASPILFFANSGRRNLDGLS